jgi:hypothetical protein
MIMMPKLTKRDMRLSEPWSWRQTSNQSRLHLDYLNLKKEALQSFETPGTIYPTTQRKVPADLNLTKFTNFDPSAPMLLPFAWNTKQTKPLSSSHCNEVGLSLCAIHLLHYTAEGFLRRLSWQHCLHVRLRLENEATKLCADSRHGCCYVARLNQSAPLAKSLHRVMDSVTGLSARVGTN